MDWRATYTKLLGRELEGIAFLPITCDTPLLLSQLEQPRHWFSGAVCMGFVDADDLFLTWHTQRMVLQAMDRVWTRFGLDRITVSPEEPWAALNRATLDSVHLFSDSAQSPQDIVAARHDLITTQGIVSFWVCTGNAPMDCVGEGDDLFVGLDAPTNLTALTVQGRIGHAASS